MVQPLRKAVWQILKNINIKLPYDPATPLPRELKTYMHTETYTVTFTAPLFIIAKHWKHLHARQLVNDRHNIVHPHSGVLFSNI